MKEKIMKQLKREAAKHGKTDLRWWLDTGSVNTDQWDAFIADIYDMLSETALQEVLDAYTDAWNKEFQSYEGD